MSVRENITLAHLAQFVNREHLISIRREEETARTMIDELHVRTPSPEQLVRNLSGGNQQKVVLAKWLLGKARVFLFDEPTRGIDVGAKAEIYALMKTLLENGAAIVMVSSELPEVLGMSHRILVDTRRTDRARIYARSSNAGSGDRGGNGSGCVNAQSSRTSGCAIRSCVIVVAILMGVVNARGQGRVPQPAQPRDASSSRFRTTAFSASGKHSSLSPPGSISRSVRSLR